MKTARVILDDSSFHVGRTLLFLTLVSLSLYGCGSNNGRRVVAFVQATQDPAVNKNIIEHYAWPIFRVLEKSGEPFQLDLYTITGNTASSTAFYSATVQPEPTEGLARKAAEHRFSQLRTALDKTYPTDSIASQLVDILGSLRVVDDILGQKASDKEPLYVIYISDMVQRNGSDGYDFTGNDNGKSLADCKKNLETEYGANLTNRARFSAARILVLRLDLQTLFRESTSGTEALPPPANLQDIQNFWATDVFRRFLHVAYYHAATSEVRREIQQFLQ